MFAVSESSDKSQSWGSVPEGPGPGVPRHCHLTASPGHQCSSMSIITVTLVCCQQPLRAQAVMETLLAVAARPSDGRVATVSLPLLDTDSHSPVRGPGFLLAQPVVALGCLPATLGSQHCGWHPLTSLLVLLVFPCRCLSSSHPSRSLLTASSASRPFPRASPSHRNPRGPGSPSYGCPQARACGGMWRAARAGISLSSVEIWLLV